MTIARFLAVSMTPDRTDLKVAFFASESAAFQHAQQIHKTFNRDVYVAEWSCVLRADRDLWRKEELERLRSFDAPIPF